MLKYGQPQTATIIKNTKHPYEDCCFPFWKLCSLYPQTNSTGASYYRQLQQQLNLKRIKNMNNFCTKNVYSIYACGVLARIDPNPQGQFLIGQMPDSEPLDGREEVQGHSRDLIGVGIVWDRKPTGYHVCISYRLHLPKCEIFIEYLLNIYVKY